MASINKILGVISDGIENIRLTNRLVVPVVDQTSEIDNPEEGIWIYLTGSGSRPEGMWRYTTDGWRSGSQTNRIDIGRGVESLSNNSNRRIANFTVPDGETLNIWTAQVSESAGAVNGTLLQVQNVTDGGTVIFEIDAGVDGIGVQQGNPLFETDGGGDEYRVRLRNESGDASGITGFMSISIENLPQ